jgi:1-acyl-sn-glycerol-3-phosphate acyltransferase
MIRSIIAAIYIALLVTFGGPPMMLYTFLTRSGDALYHGGLGGTLLIARAVGIRVRAEGVGNIPPGTCVFAANHTSNVDPPMIMGAIQRRVALLAKESLFRIPILGPAFRMGEFVPVDRADGEEALASLDLAAGYMKNGRSFLIYPEGTRSPDGRLLRFKSGAFALAIKAGVPVVPVACAGAQRVMPKKSLRITPGELVVKFCAPIDASKYTMAERGKLAARVHEAIAAALPPDQQPLSRS